MCLRAGNARKLLMVAVCVVCVFVCFVVCVCMFCFLCFNIVLFMCTLFVYGFLCSYCFFMSESVVIHLFMSVVSCVCLCYMSNSFFSFRPSFLGSVLLPFISFLSVLACLFVCRLADWMDRWMDAWMDAWMHGWLVGRSVGRLVGWLVSWLSGFGDLFVGLWV